MTTIYEGNTQKSVEKLAIALKDKLTIPEWTKFVKTGAGKERTPSREDWYYVRAASVLRKVYLKGPIGVAKLRVKYGNKKNRGHKPEKFYRGSGKIIRSILQQLEKANLLKDKKEGVHKGRIIAPLGISLVDKNTVR